MARFPKGLAASVAWGSCSSPISLMNVVIVCQDNLFFELPTRVVYSGERNLYSMCLIVVLVPSHQKVAISKHGQLCRQPIFEPRRWLQLNAGPVAAVFVELDY